MVLSCPTIAVIVQYYPTFLSSLLKWPWHKFTSNLNPFNRFHQISRFLQETHLLVKMVNMVNHAIPTVETRPMPWWSPSWNSQSLLHIHYSCCEPSNTSQVWEMQFKMQMFLFRFVWHLFTWNHAIVFIELNFSTLHLFETSIKSKASL